MAGPYPQHALSLHDGVVPNLQMFSNTELRVLALVADKWVGQTARELVTASHGEEPWIATGDGETIPYPYAYYRRKFEPLPDDEEHMDALVSMG
jgi:hypothetical protein